MGPLDVQRLFPLPVVVARALRARGIRGHVTRAPRSPAHGLARLCQLLESRTVGTVIEGRQAKSSGEGIHVRQSGGVVVGIDYGDRLAATITGNPRKTEPIREDAVRVAAQAVGAADLVRRKPRRGRVSRADAAARGQNRHSDDAGGKFDADRQQHPRFEQFAAQPAVIWRVPERMPSRFAGPTFGTRRPFQKTKNSTHNSVLSQLEDKQTALPARDYFPPCEAPCQALKDLFWPFGFPVRR